MLILFQIQTAVAAEIEAILKFKYFECEPTSHFRATSSKLKSLSQYMVDSNTELMAGPNL